MYFNGSNDISVTITTKVVESIIHSVNCHAQLKDSKSGKYLDTNQKHLDIYGLSKSTDLIGLTVWDLNSFMSKMWLDNARQTLDFDLKVYKTGRSVIYNNRIWLNAHGLVWKHHMSKIPVFDNNGKVSAILSLGEDLTATVSLFDLFRYYCSFYKDNHQQIKMFLTHLDIFKYFSSLPTHAETQVIIAKKMFAHNKLVAAYLNISLRTVESHINKLGQKTLFLQSIFSNY